MENSPSTHNQFGPEITRPNGAGRAARPVVSRVAEVAHQSVDKVAEAATPTAEWLSGKSEALTRSARNAIAEARVCVTANPWQSLGAAVAVGFLLGRLAR